MTKPRLRNMKQCSVLRVHTPTKFFLTSEKCGVIISLLLEAKRLLTYIDGLIPSLLVGIDCREGPPVPIPNTEVKLTYADNTWRATAREDR